MIAEYQEFNGDWFKDCTKCKKPYGSPSLEGLSNFFTKNKHKTDGYDSCCKKCKKEYRRNHKDKELERWKKYYKKGSLARKRHIIRSQTRKKYGSAKNYICNMCSKQANEWHHIEYKTDYIIPLCDKCHTKL